MTEPLSPAAQAVLDAVAAQMEGGWISPDFLPYERKKLAAALRAAADHINHDWSGFNCVDALYEIAAELEGSNA